MQIKFIFCTKSFETKVTVKSKIFQLTTYHEIFNKIFIFSFYENCVSHNLHFREFRSEI